MDLGKQIVSLCTQIANNQQISGACLCLNAFDSIEETKTPLEILLIIKGFKPKLMTFVKFFDDKPAIFYVVDKHVFEGDVESGLLGEAFSAHLLFPYKPLIGEKYLGKRRS
jgi:hypothetical protein